MKAENSYKSLITLSIEHKMAKNGQRWAPTDRVVREVRLDGMLLHHEDTTFGHYVNDNSILRQLELWVIDAESSMPNPAQHRKDRLANRRDFVGFFKQAWRKLFTKQVNLQS